MGLGTKINDSINERIADAVEAVARQQAGVQAGLAEFVNAQRLTAARALPADGRQLAWSGSGRLVGWSVHSDDGATLRLRDGREEGAVLAVVELPPGGSSTFWMGPGGVTVTESLFLERTGPLTGAVYLGGVD